MKIYCTIVSVVKYREIFQVYNNHFYPHYKQESYKQISKKGRWLTDIKTFDLEF